MVAFRNNVDLFRAADSLLSPPKLGADKENIWLDETFPDGFRYVMMAKIVPKEGHAYEAMFKKTVRRVWWSAIEASREIDSFVEGDYAVCAGRRQFRPLPHGRDVA